MPRHAEADELVSVVAPVPSLHAHAPRCTRAPYRDYPRAQSRDAARVNGGTPVDTHTCLSLSLCVCMCLCVHVCAALYSQVPKCQRYASAQTRRTSNCVLCNCACLCAVM